MIRILTLTLAALILASTPFDAHAGGGGVCGCDYVENTTNGTRVVCAWRGGAFLGCSINGDDAAVEELKRHCCKNRTDEEPESLEFLQ